jgi:hypothetical protein
MQSKQHQWKWKHLAYSYDYLASTALALQRCVHLSSIETQNNHKELALLANPRQITTRNIHARLQAPHP